MDRVMFVSQIKQGLEEIFIGSLSNSRSLLALTLKEKGFALFTVFRYERLLLIYSELEGEYSPEAGIWETTQRALLQTWPGEPYERYEYRMNDVFHDDCPMSYEVPWRPTGYQPERRVGSLARLKPDKYASYVYFHFQLQEEKPRQFNKYYLIGSFEQYLFSYQELPAIVEAPRKGLLSSSLSPSDWQGAMKPHFECWSDSRKDEQDWRVLEEVFRLEVPSK